MGDSIDLRTWNRTLLARQHLLERVDEDVAEVVDRCVGIQAQDPRAPHYALWSRIDGYDPADLDGLLLDRELVRLALMRSTLFLMDGLDARWIRCAVQPVLDAQARTHVKKLSAVTVDEVVAEAGRILRGAAEPVPGARLRAALAGCWPDEPPAALLAVARAGLPLVQVPPRGLWDGAGAPAFRLLDDWIGPGDPAVTGDEALRDLVRMYLRGFGPSSIAAIQAWCGLTGLRPLVTAMADDWELAVLTGPGGEELFDLEGLALCGGAAAAPTRLLAPYDGVLTGVADRIRIADPGVFRRTVTPNGRQPGYVLVDGRLAGSWTLAAGRVELTELVDLQPAERAGVEAEAARLEDLLGG